MTNVISALSVEQVSNLTQLSVHQLREWDNDGFFLPTLAYKNRKSPYSRIYTFDDVVGLRTLSILRNEYSVSRQHLKKAAERLIEHSGWPWSSLAIYVLNREVHFYNPQTSQIEGAVSGQIAMSIHLSSVAEDMRQKAENLRKRPASTFGKIESHRYTMQGDPVIAGTRVTVSAVKSFNDAGFSVAEIIKQYPSLRDDDVRAAIDYGVGLTQAA